MSAWQALGWTAEPDPAALAAEHEALCLTLEQAGAEVVVAEPRGLDAIYTYDAALVADAGVVLLRPGKEARRDEPEALVPYLDRVLARLAEPAFAEGGDLFWLAPGVLCAGLGYRTNTAGVEALRRLLGCKVHAFDLVHAHGPGQCMHLLSVISPLADDLALVFPPLMPVRLVQLLAERAIETVEVPHEEYETLGCNASGTRAAGGADCRAERGDAAAARGGRRRGARLQGGRAGQGRGRADVPEPAAHPRLGSHSYSTSGSCSSLLPSLESTTTQPRAS